MLAGKIVLFPLRFLYDNIFFPVYKGKLAKYVASLCDAGSTVLDVGCDTGYTATSIMKNAHSLKFIGVDVQRGRPALIEKKLYDGRNLPFPDNSFDIVIALDVLHHTRDIAGLLSEMRRVSRKYVIVKDHRKYGFFSNLGISLFDWLANVGYGIKCVFNYPTLDKWKAYFQESGLEIVGMPEKLYFGFGLSGRYNPIFKLKKVK